MSPALKLQLGFLNSKVLKPVTLLRKNQWKILLFQKPLYILISFS